MSYFIIFLIDSTIHDWCIDVLAYISKVRKTRAVVMCIKSISSPPSSPLLQPVRLHVEPDPLVYDVPMKHPQSPLIGNASCPFANLFLAHLTSFYPTHLNISHSYFSYSPLPVLLANRSTYSFMSLCSIWIIVLHIAPCNHCISHLP